MQTNSWTLISLTFLAFVAATLHFMIMLLIITNTNNNSSRSTSHNVRGAFGVVVGVVGDDCGGRRRRASASILISYF